MSQQALGSGAESAQASSQPSPLPTSNSPTPPVNGATLQENNIPLHLPQISTNVDQVSTNKRPTEDVSTPSAKRTKVNDGTSTPGTMGPPSAMGPPSSAMLKKKDDGLDEGDPNDILGGAGINLLDEERNISSFDLPRTSNTATQTSQKPTGDQARKSDFLDYPALQYLINKKLSEIGLGKFDDEVHGLVGMALKERLAELLSRMIVLAKHRCAPPPENAKPIDDVGRILRNISLKEAQEEERRRSAAALRRAEEEAKRREAEEASSTSKKKPARSLTEQAAARNTNATAQMMLNQSGGKKYSWMTGAPNTSQLSRRSTAQVGTAIQANVFKAGAEELAGQVTLRDFINAMELEGEPIFGRGGKALCRAYTMLKD